MTANATRADASENNLLRSLSESDFGLLADSLESTRLATGTVLHDVGQDVRHCYFPVGESVASFVVPMENGVSVEAAIVGREGAVGGVVSQGRLPAYSRCVAQFGGEFFRIETRRLEELKSQSVNLRHLFARYSDCFIAQVFQSAACNAVHSIEARSARWLLAALDRTGSDRVALTQEQFGQMLGVGRSYVSRVLQTIKARGLIDLRRGGISLTNVAGLVELECECNSLIREHFEKVLRGVYPND
jgi:hypothetical protein